MWQPVSLLELNPEGQAALTTAPLAKERSAHNPKGLPERTILEARVYEFGPVNFPAYSDATSQLGKAGADACLQGFRFVS